MDMRGDRVNEPSAAGVELDLTDIAFGGAAIGRQDGEVVFVPYGLPGERVRVRPLRERRNYKEAELVEVLDAASGRLAPPCPYFGDCGGCQWQHADYSTQLAMKRKVVVDQLRRIGGFGGAEELVRSPLGMIEPWRYRNHVRFSLGRKYGDVGYTHRGTRRLLPIDYCLIAHPELNAVLESIQRRCIGLRAHQIAVRYGCNTGDLLISPRLPSVPELESGQTMLREQVLDRTFWISAASFFQVNTKREPRPIPPQLAVPWLGEREGSFSMADLLALIVLDRLNAGPDAVILDAYCGVGTFTALLAPHVQRVIGVEESPAAVADAKRNSADLDNVRYLAAKSEEAILELDEPHLDAVVVDPSRVGCAPALLEALLERRPRRLVYVSCDPATLARDLHHLCEGGYRIEQVEPLDLFPQTYHIESVTTLRRDD
jgi:23S rRNA (uracil1939-C5)-methyltransferase